MSVAPYFAQWSITSSSQAIGYDFVGNVLIRNMGPHAVIVDAENPVDKTVGYLLGLGETLIVPAFDDGSQLWISTCGSGLTATVSIVSTKVV